MGGPGPNADQQPVELVAAMREARELRALVGEMLAALGAGGHGEPRVGQVQIAKWRVRAGLGS